MTSVDGRFTQYLLDIAEAQTKMACILENIERKLGPQETVTYGPETVEAIRLVLKDISEDVENRVEDSMHRAIEENTSHFFGPFKDRTLYMSGVYDIIRILNDELDKLMAKEVEE